MKSIVMEWSLDRKKFKDIILYGLKETLGCVNGTEWKLVVRPSYEVFLKTNPRRYCNGPNPLLTFELIRSSALEEIDVSTKIICYNKVFSEDVTIYKDRTSEVAFKNFNIQNMVDYRLEFFLILPYDEEVCENTEEEFDIEMLVSLSSRFQEMFEKELMADVVLKCDSMTLKAHKSVLSIQSPVFEAMFTTPMLENESDTVVIKDIDPCVFRTMIAFMYSGQLKVESESLVYQLLYAAEKYQVMDLKEGCIEYLSRILNQTNAIRILEVSDLFAKQLKLECVDFITKNFEELKSTKEWMDLKLKNPVLSLEVYSCRGDN